MYHNWFLLMFKNDETWLHKSQKKNARPQFPKEGLNSTMINYNVIYISQQQNYYSNWTTWHYRQTDHSKLTNWRTVFCTFEDRSDLFMGDLNKINHTDMRIDGFRENGFEINLKIFSLVVFPCM